MERKSIDVSKVVFRVKHYCMENFYQSFQPTLSAYGLKRFSLTLESVPPCSVLRGAVHSYLQVHASQATPYPIIPDGGQSIFISPKGSIIGGAQFRAYDFQILEAGTYFGIRFRPAALNQFFKLDLSDITDQFVDHHYFPCPQFADLHNKIYNNKCFNERARACEDWLLSLFKPLVDVKFNHALSLIYQSYGNLKVNQLVGLIGWSSRHLNRKFRMYTGLSTKAFIQTIRIQQACQELYLEPSSSLAVAHHLGFFDQSHLLKDYRRLLYSPGGIIFNR